MKRVLKYEVLVGHPLEIIIPSMSAMAPDCVHVDLDQTGSPDRVWIWLEIDESEHPTKRRFEVFPTGVPVPDDAEHCGSVRHISTGLVWHVYEEVVR